MTPDWIAADWGTSALRVWAMRGEDVLAEAQSAIDQQVYPVYREMIAPHLDAESRAYWEQIYACKIDGMNQPQPRG